MDYLQAIVLAVVQGFTEFLPISSSAHLILVPRLLGWEDQGLAFDVAVHVGSLAAVVWYFRHELHVMFNAWLASIFRGVHDTDSRLAWMVVLATIPAGLAGLTMNDYIEVNLRSELVIAATTIGFGLVLWFADVIGKRERDEHSIGWREALIIGCAQAMALIPGTSRSGITITAGLMLGLTRSAAARFSFLMSIPLIVLAGSNQGIKLSESGMDAPWGPVLVGTVVSGVSAYVCIHFMIKLLDRIGMLPFVVYRLLLGAFLIYLFA